MANATSSDVTIKLGLVRQGEETVFRRIPVELLSLTETNTTSGIDIIKRYAVMMFEGTTDISMVKIENYSIVLMYKDLDDDKVLIYTDYDIIAALKEFSMSGKLKILAELTVNDSAQEANRSTVSTQTFVFKGETLSETFSQASTEATTEPASSSNHTEGTAPAREVPKSVPSDLSSSIANILNFAATAAASAAHSAATSKTVTDALNKAATAVEEQAKKVSASAEANARTAQTTVNQGAQNAVRSTERAARQAARCARKATRYARRSGISLDEVVNLESVSTVQSSTRNVEFTTSTTTDPPSNPTMEPVITERPFIHGRHTCDGCLTTPIIGKRFHAANLQDYDLCERCMLARTSESTEFTFEEVLLDRDVPMQDRWHARRSRLLGRRLNLSSCGKGSSSFGKPVCPSFVPSSPVPPPAPQHPPQNPPKGRSVCSESNDADLALEEAIRRSLEDQGENGQSTEVVDSNDDDDTKTASVVEVETVLEKEAIEDENVHVANVDMETDISVVAEPVVSAEVVLETDFVTEPEIVVEPTVVVGESIPTSTARLMAAASVESMSDEASQFQTEFYTFMGDGEGTTADIIGSTLDKMAEAIEGLTWQLDRSLPSETSNLEQDNVEIESDDGTSHSNTTGEKIVDGDDDFEDDDSGSWSVVPGDEHLGRAASALGSALFNSEMQRSSEGVPASVSSGITDVFDSSTVSSVPTTVVNLNVFPSVPSVQLERWSAQLRQLRELGFENDHQSVDILETLNAANIGVDNDEEVSVEQVINAIMKDS